MAESDTSVQRSFRLSPVTAALLDRLAEHLGESRNALADRLLGEAVRTQDHPLVRFRTGPAGRREPALTGTRLLVRQVVQQVRDEQGDPDAVAAYLSLPVAAVRAALSYYADFGTEIDADAAWAARIETDEHARWQREQAVVA